MCKGLVWRSFRFLSFYNLRQKCKGECAFLLERVPIGWMDDACRSGAIAIKSIRLRATGLEIGSFLSEARSSPHVRQLAVWWPLQFLSTQVSRSPSSPASTSEYDVRVFIPVQSLTPVKVLSPAGSLVFISIVTAGFRTPPLTHSGQRHPTRRLSTTFCFWAVIFARYYEAFPLV